jgi:hypothetical protein
VQVDPIKPTLKAPGTKRLKLKGDDLLSSFGFKFNLCRYTWAVTKLVRMHPDIVSKAGAYTRPYFSSTRALLSTV